MNIGKKILSAFVEITEEKPTATINPSVTPVRTAPPPTSVADGDKFRQHFDQLFAEANLPGPDYYEFSRMVEAMESLPDEAARYNAAFAGLSVQGLTKEKLLATAAEYLKIAEADGAQFFQSLAAMRDEKVERKQQEREEKSRRIEQLSAEITELHSRIEVLQNEILETEERISINNAGYRQAAERIKTRIESDLEKIRQYVG